MAVPQISGYLRGFDPFMNVVIEETMEFVNGEETNELGTTVRYSHFPSQAGATYVTQ